jgi:alcohol dehydrogenase
MGNETYLELRKFVAPEIILGLDARLLIGRYITHFGAKNPMIVTDKQVRQFSWYEEIITAIKENTNNYVVFDEITPNPKDFEAMFGAEFFLSHDCDILIAIGGGSPMDCAKCISIVATNGGHILDYEGVDEIKLPGPPLICIPSTAGTSADVSQFAIICDTVTKTKKAIISKKVVPDLALIDPATLLTMDRYLTACTGMDALTHAIEAYVSNAQSALTDVHALEAIKLINANIEVSVSESRRIESLYQMMLGSLQAGLAFSNASLGAVHAMAHSLGGLLDLPHGECNSVLLGPVMELNFDAVPDRFRKIGEQLGIRFNSCSDLEAKTLILQRINQIRDAVGIKAYIEVDSFTPEVIDKLVKSAMMDPCMVTNPKILTEHEVRSIYESVLQLKK